MNKYARFYAEGFAETGRRSLVKRANLDAEKIAEDLVELPPGDIWNRVHEIAISEGSVLTASKEQNRWRADNKDDLNGEDAAAAYVAYCQGQIDALAFELLRDVADAIHILTHEDEDEDEDDEDDEDGDGDGDDEDDDDGDPK